MFALRDPSLFVGQNYINGHWNTSEANFNVYDPASNDIVGSCPESTPHDAIEAISAAEQALPAWKALSGRERSRVLRRWYDLVLANKDDLAQLITLENGKSLQDARGEVQFAASFLEWFSEEAARIYGDVISSSNAGQQICIVREPVGVCGIITPWNYPAAMVTRKVAPALAAGCTAVVKSDGQTPFTANALVVLAERSGVPKGVLNIITALHNTPTIGRVLCESNIVRKISFTGSTRVGQILTGQSSGSLQRLSLELGGNAPFIVFNDADLDQAVAGTVASKFKSTGQTCVCANRIYVHRGIYEKFTSRLVDAVRQFRVGPGQQESTTHGPLINASAVAKVGDHVEDAVRKGAQIAIGGQRLSCLGPNFYAPTVLTGCNDWMIIAHEETFGPVAALFPFTTEEEVLRAANHTDVGLASYIYTNDIGKAHRVSAGLQVGMIAINTGVISDAPAPFGGIKRSGQGREGSKYALEDYTELKMIVTGNLNLTVRAHI